MIKQKIGPEEAVEEILCEFIGDKIIKVKQILGSSRQKFLLGLSNLKYKDENCKGSYCDINENNFQNSSLLPSVY